MIDIYKHEINNIINTIDDSWLALRILKILRFMIR